MVQASQLLLSFVLLCDIIFCAPAKQKWDGFIVTWAGEENPMAFGDLPRTTQEAINGGWRPLDQECRVDAKTTHVGQRYILEDDIGALPIYDINGYIAGLQVAFPRNLANQVCVYDFVKEASTNQDVILGKNVYVVTLYFVEPEVICNQGRTAQEFEIEGTGRGLFIQNGTDPVKDSLRHPYNEGDGVELAKLGWTKEYCAPEMGQHYYSDFRPDKECADLFPFFLMYSPQTKDLVGFGTYVFGNYSSKRFEYPDLNRLGMISNRLPECGGSAYEEAKGITTLHMYVVSNPQSLSCD